MSSVGLAFVQSSSLPHLVSLLSPLLSVRSDDARPEEGEERLVGEVYVLVISADLIVLRMDAWSRVHRECSIGAVSTNGGWYLK